MLFCQIGNRCHGHILPKDRFSDAFGFSLSLGKRDQRLDHPVLFGLHHPERLLDVLEWEPVRCQREGIDTPRLDQAHQAAHPLRAAGAQRRSDGLVAHAHAPGQPRDRHAVAIAVVADVGDGPARARHTHARGEGLRRAQGLDRRIHALAAREFHDRLDGVLLGEVHDHVAAILHRQRDAVRHGLNPDDQPRTAEASADGRHQTHGPLREHGHAAADGNVRELGRDESGGEHVTAVRGLLVGEAVGNGREVGHGVVDVEVLGKAAILEVGELPPAEHPAALAWIAALAIVARVARRDGADRNTLADLEQTTGGREFAQFVDHADGLVPERQALAVADRTRHGVGVGGADERGGRADDGVARSRAWDGLIHHADLADAVHHETLHHLGHNRSLRWDAGVRRCQHDQPPTRQIETLADPSSKA